MDEEEVIRDILAGNINRYAEIVKSYQTIEQCIVAVNVHIGTSVPNLCLKGYTVQNQVSISQMVNATAGIQRGSGQEEVSALSTDC